MATIWRLAKLLLWTSMLVSCGKNAATSIDISRPEEAWNANNNPARLKDQLEVRLAALPLSGDAAKMPWTDTYWPSYKGGLAYRWQEPQIDSFTYLLHDQNAVKRLDIHSLKRLSPAEKYDIFQGRFDYPLTTFERKRTSPDLEKWHGLCHGWAPAAINFAEPAAVTLTGASGIQIPFGSSDVKALLTFVQQYNRPETDNKRLGDRCNFSLPDDPRHATDPQCRDVNAGSFHTILANQLGIQKEAFVAEVTRDKEVWNQPVFGFSTEVLGELGSVYASAAPGTAKVVKVRTTMKYTLEYGPGFGQIPVDRYPQQIGKKDYNYTLELNSTGEIIGGEWLQYDRPDFLWTQPPPVFDGYFKSVLAIYQAALR